MPDLSNLLAAISAHATGAPARWSMPTAVSRREAGLLLAVLALLLLACLAPAVAQFQNYHAFADQRAWGGLPHAADVLSNLPFALLGMWGGALCWRATGRLPVAQWCMALLFFAGLVVTAVCSSLYHLAPDDTRLLLDRGGMVLPFAGLLGLAACRQISARAGQGLAGTVLLLGWASIGYWQASANVLPWGVLQFGGMALLLVMARLDAVQPGGLDIRWGLLLGLYAVAKALELLDAPIYQWSAHAVSGHSLKHVVAACAALPVMAALRRAPTPTV